MLTRNYSETDMDSPEPLVSKTWLETVLTQHSLANKPGPVNVAVNSFIVSQGTTVSTLSKIIAVAVDAEIDGEPETFYFVIKLLPTDPFSKFFVTEAGFDLREINFYSQVVPDLEEFQNRVLNNKNHRITLPVPKCYFTQYSVNYDSFPSPVSVKHEDEESAIVLEDLRKRGYVEISFSDGLTVDQAKSAFEAISRFHALCLAMKIYERESLGEKYDFLFQLEKACGSYQHLMERGFPQLLQFLEERGNMTEIIQALSELRNNTKDLLEKFLAPKEPLSLITHNDFWSNNLLFKGDDCIILDWQMATYSRPTNDLALLIITSLAPVDRRVHAFDLLDFYWDHLTSNAKKLGLDIGEKLHYDREKLKSDYRASQLLALLLCIGSVDVALKDEQVERRLIEVLKDFHRNGILSPDYIKQLD